MLPTGQGQRMQFNQLRRREFISLLGGAAAWPLAASAQQPAKLPTIGFIGAGTPSIYAQWVTAFVQRLRELGRIEGQNIAIEYRWAEGRSERYTDIATEFVRLQVDVIVSIGTPASLAAKQATAVIPIVFVASADPIGAGLIAGLARPGGNITGVSNQHTDLAGKRLEILREVIPTLHRLAIMLRSDNPASALEVSELQSAAKALGLEIVRSEIQRAEEIAPTFESLVGRADVLYVASDPLFTINRVRVNMLALGARLPTMYGFRDLVEAGGLMSYGASYPDLFRRAADYVDKVLRGTKPADIPVEQPTKFDLVINLTTAKVLGLTIPESFLSRADEVIE
jgi:putative ABC transport system substrate-binding protein